MYKNGQNYNLNDIKEKIELYEEFFTVNGARPLYEAIMNIPQKCTVSHNDSARFKELEKAKVMLLNLDFLDYDTLKSVEPIHDLEDDLFEYEMDELIEICDEMQANLKIKNDALVQKKLLLLQQEKKFTKINNSAEKIDFSLKKDFCAQVMIENSEEKLKRLECTFKQFQAIFSTLISQLPIDRLKAFLEEFSQTQSDVLEEIDAITKNIKLKPTFLSTDDMDDYELIKTKLSEVIFKKNRIEAECVSLNAQIDFLNKYDDVFPTLTDGSCEPFSKEICDRILRQYSANYANGIIYGFDDVLNVMKDSYYKLVDYYLKLASNIIKDGPELCFEHMYEVVAMHFDFYDRTAKIINDFSRFLIEIDNNLFKNNTEHDEEIYEQKKDKPSKKYEWTMPQQVDKNEIFQLLTSVCDISKGNGLTPKRSTINQKVEAIKVQVEDCYNDVFS